MIKPRNKTRGFLYTTTMAKQNLEGIVLRSINYKDADKIYTIFTKELGKITCSARGVRKISSKRSGNLDTLNHISFVVTDTSSKHKIITEVSTKNAYFSIKNDLTILFKAYSCIELVKEILEEETENRQVFNTLMTFLDTLEAKIYNPEYLHLKFKINLLNVLGYSIDVLHCSRCNSKNVNDWSGFGFSFSLGGLVCEECKLVTPDVMTISKAQALALYLAGLKGLTDRNLDVLNFNRAHDTLDLFIKENISIEIRSEKLASDIGL